ncbi:MAG TPA: transcriptional regulator [Thermodesulfovibrionia bacterium]|nr:transcriptional regulator [Thermodesulfovibrionia bacterium]
MNTTTVNYEAGLQDALSDPLEAAAYLNAALEEGSQEAFLLTLQDIAEAKGIYKTTSQTRLNMESLHGILYSKEYPQLTALNILLRSLGLKLAVQVEKNHSGR